jgi:hypothetical protein
MTTLSFKKPSREKAERDALKLARAEKRIVADVPEAIHRQVKLRCLERGVLLRDYILELLARDGIS